MLSEGTKDRNVLGRFEFEGFSCVYGSEWEALKNSKYSVTLSIHRNRPPYRFRFLLFVLGVPDC
jgi:hypothetical protein